MAESKDIEINQFPIVSSLSNKDYVVVSLDDGSQGRIKTSDLASVVAAVPEFYNLVLNQAIRYWVGINTNDISSFYFANVNSKGSTNWPSNYHGLFLNVPCGPEENIQIVYDIVDAIYIRRQWSGVWSSWTKLH